MKSRTKTTLGAFGFLLFVVLASNLASAGYSYAQYSYNSVGSFDSYYYNVCLNCDGIRYQRNAGINTGYNNNWRGGYPVYTTGFNQGWRGGAWGGGWNRGGFFPRGSGSISRSSIDLQNSYRNSRATYTSGYRERVKSNAKPPSYYTQKEWDDAPYYSWRQGGTFTNPTYRR